MEPRERAKTRYETAAIKRAMAMEKSFTRERAEVIRLQRELSDMRQDRDAWREQAKRTTEALARIKERGPVPAAITRGEAPQASPLPHSAGRDADLLYGIKGIAEHLQISENKVRHMTRRCGLPTFSPGGRSVCARKSSINEWLRSKEGGR